MNSIVARLHLSSIVFLLPLIVAAQPDDSYTIGALDPESGEPLPTSDGKAPIEGTPGDGVRDHFNYVVVIAPRPQDVWSEPDPDAGRLELEVKAYDDDFQPMVAGTDVIDDIDVVAGVGASISGRIDLSIDTEIGQMLEFFGRFEIVGRPVAEFRHVVTVGCECPRAGSWTAYNAPGSMVCTGLGGFTLPLSASTQTGTLQVSNGCRSLYTTNFSDEYADIPMERVPGECGYEGQAQGAGIPMVIEFKYDVHNEELIAGNLHSEVNQQGMTCIMSRDFEVRFNE